MIWYVVGVFTYIVIGIAFAVAVDMSTEIKHDFLPSVNGSRAFSRNKSQTTDEQ